jgi:hypothetical protein
MYPALMADWINFQKYLPVRYRNESRMVSVVEHSKQIILPWWISKVAVGWNGAVGLEGNRFTDHISLSLRIV